MSNLPISLVSQIFQIVKEKSWKYFEKNRELKIFSRQVKTTTRIISQDQLQ